MLNSDLAGSTYEDAEHFFMADCQDLGEKVGKVRFLILIKFRKDLYTFLTFSYFFLKAIVKMNFKHKCCNRLSFVNFVN